MAIPRLISEAKSRNRWKSLKRVKHEMVSLGSHLESGVVPYRKIGHFGRVEVSRLAGAWLAGQVS